MSQVQLSEPISQGQWRPECGICQESVYLEESKTDECGQAIHEECYVSTLMRKRRMSVFRCDPAPNGPRCTRSAHVITFPSVAVSTVSHDERRTDRASILRLNLYPQSRHARACLIPFRAKR
jgi:hypothetical protein